MRLAIVPGSFDPMTLGHLELVKQARARYDRVVVAIMNNAQKQYLFTTEERIEIAKRTISHLQGVEVLFDGGMLVDLYDRLQACAVCKGWRTQADLAYEKKMDEWNRAHNPRFVADFIPAEESYRDISSTEVRRRLETGESLHDLVHPQALSVIEQKRSRL